MTKGVVGTKSQVWKGMADKTGGGLRKDDLVINKRGKIVSKRQHEAGLRRMPPLDSRFKKTTEELE